MDRKCDRKYNFTEGGLPFVCGGVIGDPEPNDTLPKYCYKYDATLDEWAISGTMPKARYSSGYDSSEIWGLIMAGGIGSFTMLPSVTTTDNGEVFGSLPHLPNINFTTGSENPCVVIIDEDRIFTCGGWQSDTDTLIFSNSTGTWSR